MTSSLLVFGILFLVCVSAYSQGTFQVVSSIADYQYLNSGFTFDGATPSLEATYQAIYLASYFGQRDKVDVPGVSVFLKQLNNGDNGFADVVGERSELTALKNALLTMNYLALPVATNDLKAHIMSLYDANTGLFSNAYGDGSTLKATATALECLSELNALDKVDLDEIKSVLEKLVITGDNVKYFSSDLIENYYGIVAASLVGFEFENVLPYAGFILQNQLRSGDYAGSFVSGGTTSPQITEAAVSSINILNDMTEINLIQGIDRQALVNFLGSYPRDLAAAAYAFKTISSADLVEIVLKTRIVYESLQDVYSTITDRITQGLEIKPKLSVRTPTGLPHAGLDVSVHITDSEGKTKTIKLPWDVDAQYYAGLELYRAETLGEVTLKFDIKWAIADVDSDMEYTIVQEKTIGYKVKVTSNAELAGKAIEEGGVIGIGTQFDFALNLETAKQKNLLNGDFVVDFNVKDSAGEIIFSQPLDCSANNKAISFSYVLEKLNIPSGVVVFSFGIKSAGSNTYHTVQEVQYSLVMKMIATEINFPETTLEVGETMIVSMSPASFPDLTTVIPLTSTDETLRRFQMIVFSSDTIIKTVEGSPVAGGENLRFEFRLTVDPTFDSLGKHSVQFQYLPEYGEPSYLENYDSKIGELFSELETLSYTVESKSQIVDVTGTINSGELRYGNKVELTFRVQDTISGEFIFPKSNEYTVFLRLKHKDENGAVFIGDSQAASVIYKDNQPDHFAFDWNVSPNVVKGSAELELIMQTPNGPITLLGEDDKEWRKDVTIGGDVEVATNSHSGEIDEKRTIFTMEFSLSCDNVRLSKANLVAVVSRNGQQLVEAPVAQAQGAGDYELSWVINNKLTESGQYDIDFYRQVDVLRSDGFDNIKPFFSSSINHERNVEERGIVPTQFLVLLLLLAGFGYTSWRKMKIESYRK